MQAWVKRGLPKAGSANTVRAAQAESVLFEASAAKELRSEGAEYGTVPYVQYLVNLWWHPGPLAPQFHSFSATWCYSTSHTVPAINVVSSVPVRARSASMW
ncbi:hypothetical protein GCM10027082_47250 [Comamonas humi]